MIQEEKKKSIWDLFSGNKKKTRILIVVGVIGVVLLLAGEMLSNLGAKNSTANMTFDENQYNEQYLQNLKDNLTAVLSKVEGVGAVEVMITLETGVQYVYATNEKTTGDRSQEGSEEFAEKNTSETTVILVDGASGKEPLVLKRIEPTVQGVVVVCQGAGSVQVREAIIEAVMIVCGVKSNRVSVIKMH